MSCKEPITIKDTLLDDEWIIAMQEELAEFERKKVWNLVLKPKRYTIVGTRWVFHNKLDDSGVVIRKKSWLVAKGYSQLERIDYDETYAPVARLEAILILPPYAARKNVKAHQMDVKSALLDDELKEEVYLQQPPCV